MFGFDGEYRRRPTQSLGGATNCSDRETIIRKAAEERLKRNQMRRENNGATVLQSYMRSFVHRQRQKRLEREMYDVFLRQYRERLTDDENLAYLLKRIIFFYNTKNDKDNERLIEVCQIILRNPVRLLQNSVTEYVWLHRVKKLLNICVLQLSVPVGSQALPLRLLETMTTITFIERHVENEQLIQYYLERIFTFLVKHNYYKQLRSLLDQKCPPLDGECLKVPNPFLESLLQLFLRPLLVHLASEANIAIIYGGFIKDILSAPFSEAIRFFLLPCLAEHVDFPFDRLVQTLSLWINSHNESQKTETAMPTSSKVMEADFTTPMTSGFHWKQKTPAKTLSTNSVKATRRDEGVHHNNVNFNGFLLVSLLILDRKQLRRNIPMLRSYILIIAEVSNKILKLPKSTLKNYTPHLSHSRCVCLHQQQTISTNDYLSDEIEDEEEADEEEEEINYLEGNVKCAQVKQNPWLQISSKQQTESTSTSQLSEFEQKCLVECIELLNEENRVQILVETIDKDLKDEHLLNALSEICHNLMIYNRMAIFEYNLLYTLAFVPSFIRALWLTLVNQSQQQGFNAPLILISKGVVPKQSGVSSFVPLLATFCMLFGRLLPTLHDVEFCDENMLIDTVKSLNTLAPSRKMMPFSLSEIVQLSKTLKEISLGLVELAFPETRTNLNQHYRFVLGRSDTDDEQLKQQKKIWSNLLTVVIFVLNHLHARDLRLGFCPETHWIVSRFDLLFDRPADIPLVRGNRTRGIRPFQPIRDFTREDLENGPPMSIKEIRSITILREIPFVVDFSKRVSILQGLVAADKIRMQGHFQDFLQGPSITLTVRRTHLYEDAYDKLRPENEPDLRLKFRVQLISALGLDEAGIDGGGVFREFLSELIKTAFDPNRGFFMVTKDNKLYPNPNVEGLVSDYEKHYYFIGRILGKAIYENLLVELPLAEFFLTKLARKYADVDIHQLASLDPELYKNLLYLKDYGGDVGEFNLDFTVTNSSFGQTQVVELKPNGRSIPVTNSNRIEYLQLMADYKLNIQIRQHCIAFRRGLSNVLPVEWLYMFSNKELQILISGAEIPIDLEDLKKHCKYGGEYNPEHPSIIAFWSALEAFDDLQRRQLLKFVTSCSRPPLLGFKDLDPPFFIQNAGDMERLPTASTCTNLLKLPPFKTVEQMREKLLYAIQSGVGFELS